MPRLSKLTRDSPSRATLTPVQSVMRGTIPGSAAVEMTNWHGHRHQRYERCAVWAQVELEDCHLFLRSRAFDTKMISLWSEARECACDIVGQPNRDIMRSFAASMLSWRPGTPRDD
jgi:hypothetical protein